MTFEEWWKESGDNHATQKQAAMFAWDAACREAVERCAVIADRYPGVNGGAVAKAIRESAGKG